MPIIELDVMIAFVNASDKLHSIATMIFNKIINGELRDIAIPTSAYMEYELILKSRGYSEDTIQSDIQAFKRITNLKEIPLTSKILIEASKLRKNYNLTYFDSLHAASALQHDKTIISTDKAYQTIPKLKTINPRQITT
ncbi:MAG: type II toxin-antitoxin system VapC family toxin [Candidatus Nezhaarchaeales archaeon]